MFRAESLELLAGQRLRPRKQPQLLDSNRTEREVQPLAGSEDPDDNPDPDDRALLALPPPSPDWSHLLGSRPHSPASLLSATSA